MSPLHPALQVFLLITALTGLHLAATVAVGRLLGLRPREVRLFAGPGWLGFRLAGTRLSLGVLPIGGAVTFRHRGTSDGEGEAPPDDEPDPIAWLPVWQQLVLHLAGCAALFGLAALLLGTQRAAAALASGFGQILAVAIPPHGMPHLERLRALVSAGLGTPAFGLMAAKLAAFNLLPLPGLSGGAALGTILSALVPIPQKVRERAALLGFLLGLGLLALWFERFLAVFFFRG